MIDHSFLAPFLCWISVAREYNIRIKTLNPQGENYTNQHGDNADWIQ